MRQKRKVQYTVRDLSEAADVRLRETASSEGISLNEAVLRTLDRGLGLTGEPVRYRDLRGLVKGAGKVDRKSWTKVIADLDRVHPEDWK